MTTIARRMPTAQQAVVAARCWSESKSLNHNVDGRMTDADRAERNTARTEYAWVQAAAMAGTRTPRG